MLFDKVNLMLLVAKKRYLAKSKFKSVVINSSVDTPLNPPLHVYNGNLDV